MVVYDQFRVSDSGKLLYIDAHVNKASYFDNVAISSLTISTEEDKEIYSTTFESSQTETHYKPATEKIQVASDDNVLSKVITSGNLAGSLCLDVRLPDGIESEHKYLNFGLIGVFKECETDTEKPPKVAITTSAFNPASDGFESPEVLFTVDGELDSQDGQDVWKFRGNGDVGENNNVYICLFKQGDNSDYTLVDISAEKYIIEDSDSETTEQEEQEVYDYNYLHLLWQMWYEESTSDPVPVKDIHLVLCPNNMNKNFTESNFSNHMFFVQIECTGDPSSDTPCGLDENDEAVTFDYGLAYTRAMNYTKELLKDCSVSQHFTDFILNFNALKLAIESGHYKSALPFWKRLTEDGGILPNTATTKSCGCHG